MKRANFLERVVFLFRRFSFLTVFLRYFLSVIIIMCSSITLKIYNVICVTAILFWILLLLLLF
jgi:hypothetical protein